MNRTILFPALGIILTTFIITWVINFRSHKEESVPVLEPSNTVTVLDTQETSDPHEIPETTIPIPTLSKYIEVIDACGPHFQGACLNVRSGPDISYPVVKQLRTGVVLQTSEATTTENGTWYKIVFDEWVRYPERINEDWFVSAKYVQAFELEKVSEATASTSATTTKEIIVDRSDQKLYAYDGNTLFMEESVSTGTELAPTPRGMFTVFRKTPSRYMQGPLPNISDDFYDLPGVPWNLYFTPEGGAIHGTYWHDKFGQQWSHGCVNLPTDKAQKLYEWADIGTPILVRD